MATKTPIDEKFEKQDFNLFDALLALDKKDYGYIDKLNAEQQKKFVPYMMTHWMSAVKGTGDIQGYYLRSVDYHANINLFNDNVQKHPKLQWLMLCAASPGLGKQFHQWIPHMSARVTSLKDPAKLKDVQEYYTKLYPKSNSEELDSVANEFVLSHKRKCYLAKVFPDLKHTDIETLAQLVTDNDISQYEKDLGN